MENISWQQILLALGLVGGAITGGVPLFKWLAELVDARKKSREAKRRTDLSNAAAVRQIEADDRAAATDELWQIIKSKDEELERKNSYIRQLENTHDLPKPLKVKINQAMKAACRQVDTLRSLIERGEKKENVISEIDILDQKMNEVDSLLP